MLEAQTNTSMKDADRLLLLDGDSWSTITRASTISRALANCIAVVDGKKTSLREGMKAVLDLGKFICSFGYHRRIFSEAREAYFSYISIEKLGESEFGLLLRAYMLEKLIILTY